MNRFIATISLVIDTAERGGFRVALIGGFALSFLGVTRATGDVDFLADAAGADLLDTTLVGAGFARKHRTENVANYAAPSPSHAPVDFLFARRPATTAMLARARKVPLASAAAATIATVDPEGVIGLKAQAMANDPRRRRQDEADILALLRANPGLDRELVRSYFTVLALGDDLERLFEEADAP